MTERIRIDKWLWHARFYKTRALAQKAARPLDGGLKVAKAQARLTTRLRGPDEGLHAMREAGAGVDPPRNMK